MKKLNFIWGLLLLTITISAVDAQTSPAAPALSESAKKAFGGKEMLYIERNQFAKDHHNTATIFQKGEINEASFHLVKGCAMRAYNVETGKIRTLVETKDGVVRDPELSYDGEKIIFSMRKNFDDSYHIYEINVDGTGIKQLTFADGISDIDPLYLPDGGIVFSSTRQPKYCMCNRHIMCNLFRMDSDGANITQIGVSTLFEGHSTMLPDGRILYDRWEYVDRNFSNAQGLWTVNPDGTKHSIYYGNNMSAPDGVIDARAIPGTDLIAAIFGDCHGRPHGALAVIDRKKGVDGVEAVVKIFPEDAYQWIGKNPTPSDVMRRISAFYEDPYPINKDYMLVSRTIVDTLDAAHNPKKGKSAMMANPNATFKTALYIVCMDGTQEQVLVGTKSLFDPMLIQPRLRENIIPSTRNFTEETGKFYVQNVYEGTHMKGVEPGSVKYLRLVESMEKRTYTKEAWYGQGQLAPGVNWHNFDIKRVVSEVEVEEDGSAYFEAPAGKFLYFQLLDKDKKMIQTMRSGVSLMPGEVNGCVGCHENRLSVPIPTANVPMALKHDAAKMTGWKGKVDSRPFGFMEQVQPILDKSCVKCHDFDPENRKKLVLAGDKNPYFNAAYINLYVSKSVKLIGAGPYELQAPYAWGSHASKLTQIIDGKHHGVKLKQSDRETLYAWMDLNGGYYPIYESSFDDTPAGRSPLTVAELTSIYQMTGFDYKSLRSFKRTAPAQISFDRPEESPILDKVRGDKAKYDKVLSLIKIGAERLEERPRGDIEDEIVLCDRHKEQLRRYAERMESEIQNTWNIDVLTKRYDK